MDPEEGHDRWRRGRDELFAHHPAGPLLPADRERFTGLPVAPYDPAHRFEVPVGDAGPQVRDVVTGTDGTVRFERVGRVRLGTSTPSTCGGWASAAAGRSSR